MAAFVASRVAAEPMVQTMMGHLTSAFGIDRTDLMGKYSLRTEDALINLVGQMDPDSAMVLCDELSDVADEAKSV